jgi:hypothetical protein
VHLIEELERRLEAEESMFRTQLMREDIARLRKLAAAADGPESLEGFIKQGLYAGWTQGDFRTHELKDTIRAVLAAIYVYETGGRTDDQDRALRAAWDAFDRERIAKLVGCLRGPISSGP